MNKGMIAMIAAAFGAVVGATASGKISQDTLEETKKLSDKHLALYLMMNQWVKLKQEGKSLSRYFEKKGYQNIAIYGMNYVGVTLLDELKNTNTHVAYAIDKKADEISAGVKVVSLEDSLENVDVVVVTAVFFFENIKRQLGRKVDCPIISLEEIIFSL